MSFGTKQTRIIANAFSRSKPRLKANATAADTLRFYTRLLQWESDVATIGFEFKAHDSSFRQNDFDALCGYDPTELARDDIADIVKRLNDAADSLKQEAKGIVIGA